MTAPIEALLKSIAGAERSVLGLDYDGTLAPFRRQPGEAVPYPGIRGLLGLIMACGRTRVVVVSGRPAGEVRMLLALRPAPEIWGAHGWERCRPDGSMETMTVPRAVGEVLGEAHQALGARGLLERAEWKAASVAVHWRNAAAQAALAPLASAAEFELMPIVEGIELRCRRWHKGTALAAVLAEEAPGVPVAYLGDDLTDEDAFTALAGRGLAIRIGTKPLATLATAVLAPGSGVVMFLERWLHATSRRGAADAPARTAT